MHKQASNHIADHITGAPAAILKQRRAELFASVLKMDPVEFVKTHADLFDAYFRDSYEASLVGPRLAINKNPFAVVALGGYGRSEQCIHSDVDVMILFNKAVPPEAEDLIREFVYPLWDIGLEIGHATRSVKECIRMGQEDYEVLTALLDARFICGISSVYADLTSQIRERILSRSPNRIIRWMVDRNRKRHADYGDSTYLLEPNLKEGAGGLRDYHTLRWIGRIKYDLRELRDLEYQGALSHDEYGNMQAALSFIWGVRNRLHTVAQRRCDQLYLDYQSRLANDAGFSKENGQLPVEIFMSKLHAKMGYVKQQLLLFLFELGFEKASKRSFRFRRQPDVPGIQLTKGGLNFSTPGRIVKSPEILIQMFELSANLRVPLTRDAGRLVREFGYLADASYWRKPGIREAFETILIAPSPSFNVLEQMLDTGFLCRLIPEFSGIQDRIQYDAYHLFPVDRHSLRTVFAIKSFGEAASSADEEGLCNQLYRGLKRKSLLLLAALLHDIGKGVPGENHSRTGAEMAVKILSRMGYDSREIDTVSFLIENHLLLVKVATRRDIHDEETAIRVARTVGKVNRLKMLYLLTIADSMATGPKAWNDWTATLVRDFFLKVLRILEKGELATSWAVRRIEKKTSFVREAAAGGFPDFDIEPLLEVLSPRYVLHTDAKDIVSHIQLYRRLGDADFAWDIVPDKDSNTRNVVVCAKDRPGLFSRISGVFTLNGIDILNARIFTWRNDIALDVFTVTPPPDQIFESERWQKAANDLQMILSGQIDLSVALADKKPEKVREKMAGRPNRVEVDNQESSFFTIVEVFTYDFPGLLYRITDALTRCDLDIWVAQIATKVDQVVDVFYVRDSQGNKIESQEQVESIKMRLLDVLSD